jgi:hypothetical protein
MRAYGINKHSEGMTEFSLVNDGDAYKYLKLVAGDESNEVGSGRRRWASRMRGTIGFYRR